MLRLTLRTLLSYLDDTLEPSEATALGAKLAESEQAQEIVERMRNVIRRRRLTVPPAASRMDPNTIAEYLDNEIGPEQAEELERICLASDVHLAEVAACHQTLSILLGDPTEVPAGAIQRMVDLAKGTPTVPRKSRPAPVSAATNHVTAAPHLLHGKVEDDTLPTLGGGSGLGRMAVVLAGAAACVLLGVAIYQIVGPAGPPSKQHARADATKGAILPAPTDSKATDAKPSDAKPSETKIPETKPIEAKAPATQPTEPKYEALKVEPIRVEPAPTAKAEPTPAAKTAPIVEADLPPPTFSTTPEPKAAAKLADVPLGPPSAAVVALGTMIEPAKDSPAVLLQRLDPAGVWVRLSAQGGKGVEISSNRALVALPASRASFDLGKVRLGLWGHVPESASSIAVVESMVELHAPSKGVDLDLTLLRGRIVIASTSDKAVVARVRFENTDSAQPDSAWLLSLPSKGTMVLLDRWGQARREFVRDPASATRKGPQAYLTCFALEGLPMLKTATETVSMSPPPGAAFVGWDSRASRLAMPGFKERPPWYDPKAKPSADIVKVRKALDAGFTGKAPDLALNELVKSPDSLVRRTAVRCLGALDDLPGLLEILNQDKAELRSTAIETLYFWIGISRNNDYKLYDKLKERLSDADATFAMTLLHGVPESATASPDTYQALIAGLVHPQMAIRELSRLNLYALVPAGSNIVYDAADPVVREAAHKRWQQFIPPGKLPPGKKAAGPY